MEVFKIYEAVADLRSKILDAPPPPPGSKFFQFHAVFGKIWQNRMLAPPWRVGTPTSGKSWISHCKVYIIGIYMLLKIENKAETGISVISFLFQHFSIPLTNSNLN